MVQSITPGNTARGVAPLGEFEQPPAVHVQRGWRAVKDRTYEMAITDKSTPRNRWDYHSHDAKANLRVDD